MCSRRFFVRDIGLAIPHTKDIANPSSQVDLLSMNNHPSFFPLRDLRVLLFNAFFAFFCTLASAQSPAIQFELVTEQGFPVDGAQSWLQLLAKLNQTSIRIRVAEAGERESIKNEGTDQKPIYHVVGVLTARNRLRFPGREFGLSDRERIGQWIQDLAKNGIGRPKKTTVFGLTEEELVACHEKLAARISCATQGRRAGDVARDIVNGAGVGFGATDAARRALGGQAVVAEDLQPLSCGTALAAVIRPLGLVFRPERAANGTFRVQISEVREVEESWPVGWPLEDIPAKIAPKLFDYLKVTITSRPLTEALSAIQKRVQVPFLMDYNGMARGRIDPAEVKVSYTKDRAMYQKIIDNLLYQAKLTSELRVDEAGTGFLWISPR